MIDVAAAVILRADGQVLFGRRPEGKPYPGYWEFPGGKIEHGETALAALKRELMEELGISVSQAHPWITRTFHYQHATVRLNFFKVVEFEGTPEGLENQLLSWQEPQAIDVFPILPANAPILRILNLPPVYAITHATAMGVDRQLASLHSALEKGLKLLQIREKQMPRDELLAFGRQACTLARNHGATVLVNADIDLAREIAADGVHLDSGTLMQLNQRPDFPWVAASAHDRRELQHAANLGIDFVVLGPVMPTASHPGAPALGWKRFAELAHDLPLPVYALGGLNCSDLDAAIEHGAHGVSMITGAWGQPSDNSPS